MAEAYDLVILGGGPAGYTAALRAAELGGRVALVEREHVGGLCLNHGCIPTKALLASAHLVRRLDHAEHLGVAVGEVLADFAEVRAHQDAAVVQLRQGLQGLLEARKVTILHGEGRLATGDTVRVETGDGAKDLMGRSVLLCPGSAVSRPPIPGAEGDLVITTEEALALPRRPERLLILGGGASGVEFADIFAALGSKVVVVELLAEILPSEEPELGRTLRRSFEERGVRVITSGRVQRIESVDSHLEVDVSAKDQEERLRGDALLLAAGRVPALSGLGFQELGGRLEGRGVAVDDHQRTNLPGVFAAGDVLGKLMLAHAAFAQGTVAAENALGGNSVFDGRLVARCVYTSPEVASVGITEAEARADGRSVLVGRAFFRANGRAVTSDEVEGLLKVVADARYGEVLGVHIVGQQASEIVGAAVLAMQLEATLEDLQRAVLPHPTLSEALVEAAQRAR